MMHINPRLMKRGLPRSAPSGPGWQFFSVYVRKTAALSRHKAPSALQETPESAGLLFPAGGFPGVAGRPFISEPVGFLRIGKTNTPVHPAFPIPPAARLFAMIGDTAPRGLSFNRRSR
jgi:hypothetical protein